MTEMTCLRSLRAWKAELLLVDDEYMEDELITRDAGTHPSTSAKEVSSMVMRKRYQL